MSKTAKIPVSYVPKILRSLCEICAEMGIGQETARRWIDEGAPIAREPEGKKIRYSAEAASLQAWRLERSL